MGRTLGGNRQTEQLARKTDRVIANVDHFLHFAQAFRHDLADFECHKTAKIILCSAEFFAEQANQLATARGWHFAPFLECCIGTTNSGGRISSRMCYQFHTDLAADR